MKTRDDSSAPDAAAKGLSAAARRELKRQLDSVVDEVARGVLGDCRKVRQGGE